MRFFGSLPDNLKITEWSAGNPIGKGLVTTGRAIRDPRLIAGERTAVLIIAGQSNSASYVSVTYTPVHGAKIDNINIYDGGTYAAVDPLLGCESFSFFTTPGNAFLRLADKLISGGMFDRVILVPIGIGGSTVGLWDTLPFGERLLVAFRRVAALGLTVTAVLWQQGESDNVGGTTQANYQLSLSSVIARPRALGFNAPWFIARSSWWLGTTSAAVRAAQGAMPNGVDIFAGPDTDTIGSSGREDNVHWNGPGANTLGDLWFTSLDVVF